MDKTDKSNLLSDKKARSHNKFSSAIINIIILVCLFLGINLLGRFAWPFAAYLTGCSIGILCYFISGTVAVIGLGLLIYAFIKKRRKASSLWLIATACALYSCCFVSIYGRYGENGCYEGEYMDFYNYEADKWPNTHGLVDKYGCQFIEPRFNWAVKVFNKNTNSYNYIGIESHELKTETIDDETFRYYSFILYLHDDKGNMDKIIEVADSDCEYIHDHIEKHIGKIIEGYGNSDDNYHMHLIYSSHKTTTDDKQEYDEDDEDMPENRNNVQEVVVHHVREKQQVWKERWRPCISCDRGKCRQCYGEGGYYIGDYYNICGSCSGTGACAWCGGRGETMETYTTWE